MQLSKLSDTSLLLKVKKNNIIVGRINHGFPKTEAQILISPGDIDREALSHIDGKPFIIQWPGEYEISDVSVFGINHIYIIDADGLRCGYLDDPKVIYTDDQVEEIDSLDILICNVNNEEAAIKTISHTVAQIQPKIVIPLGPQEAVGQFLKTINLEAQQEKKLIITQADLPEETKAIILQGKDG